jgi:predicted RNase H-like nuclease (RuvC/YqgF family)
MTIKTDRTSAERQRRYIQRLKERAAQAQTYRDECDKEVARLKTANRNLKAELAQAKTRMRELIIECDAQARALSKRKPRTAKPAAVTTRAHAPPAPAYNPRRRAQPLSAAQIKAAADRAADRSRRFD